MDCGTYTKSERRRILLAASIGGFSLPFLTTMLNLSLLDIGSTFSVGSRELGYVNTALLLASAIAVIPVSKLADIIGRRRTFLIGLAVIAAGLIAALLSPSFWWLIAGRAVMGGGAAAVLSTGTSLVTEVYPSTMRGTALGIHSMGVFIGLAGGPPIGGILNDLVGWRAMAVAPLPLIAMAAACMLSFRHEIAPDADGSLDSRETALYCAGLLTAMFGLLNISEAWGAPCIVAGLVLLMSFGRLEKGRDDGLLDIRLFMSRTFVSACIATFLIYAASFSASYFMSLYLHTIGGMRSSEAGVLMMTQASVQAAASVYFGRLSDKLRDKRILPFGGSMLTAIGVSMFLFYGTSSDLVLVIATMVLVGMGIGMFAAPNTSVIMGSVPKDKTGEASGITTVMRQTGAVTSMAVAMLCLSVTMGDVDGIPPESYRAFVDAVHIAFIICLAMCLASAAASMLRKSSDTTDDEPRQIV